jgi:hypothetical protein
LGHIISGAGVATNPKKTEAVVDWPRPTFVTKPRGFIGLTGYYRKFVRNYGTMTKPLTNLLKKKKFVWSDEAQSAFELLKVAMSSTPMLALPDFNKQFVVETYASYTGLVVVLMQDNMPIAYLSKPFSTSNKSLSIYEKEFLALIMVVEKWRPYLQRQEFLIKTDHRSLAYLNGQTLQSELPRKVMTWLMGLQFRIIYRKGKQNVAADALSRVPYLMDIQVCSEVRQLWIQEIINSYATDLHAQELLAQPAFSSPNEKGYSLRQGIIRLDKQIWVGNNSAIGTKLVDAFHSTSLGGHSGVQVTYLRIKKLFQWVGLKVDVANFVKQCAVCQQGKHERVHPAGLL